MPFKFREKL